MYCLPCTYYNENMKIWSGDNVIPIYNPNVSIGQVILSSLQKYPSKIVQISANDDIKLTNKDMEIQTIRIIKNLLKLNYKKGDVIGICSRNNTYIASIVIAALTIGMPINSLDPYFNKEEIKHMFSITQPKIIFCEYFNFKSVQEVINENNWNTQIYILGYNCGHDDLQSADILFEKCDDDYFTPPNIGDGKKLPAVLVGTSGTTGLPKCIQISHSTILESYSKYLHFIDSDVVLTYTTLYWLTGIVIVIASLIVGCTRIITTDSFIPELGLRLISIYKVTFLFTSPHHISLFVQCDEINQFNLTTLRKCIAAGGKINGDHWKLMNKHLKNCTVDICYGMSELGGAISYNNFVDNSLKDIKGEFKWNSVGQLVENIQIKILNKNNNTNVGVNEMGEICIHLNDYEFLGFLKNNNYNNTIDDNKNIMDNNNWIRSGDIGYFDASGCLFVRDRIKDLFIHNNSTISPFEMENIVSQMQSNIKSVCVVGIPISNDNELPAAVIIKNCNSSITEHDVHKYVADKLSEDEKLKGGIYFVNSFPLTPTGKIKRNELRQYAIEQYAMKKIS